MCSKALHKGGWSRVTLGEVVDVVTDYWDRNPDVPERFVAGEHIDEGDLRVRRWGMTSDELVPPTFNRRFRAGDVLFHSRNLKKLACPDFGGITGEKLFVLRSRDSSRFLPELVPFVLRTRTFTEYVNLMWAGSTNKFLNKVPLLRFEFPLPPLDEQHRILHALLAIDTSREGHSDLLERSDRLRRAILLDAFRPHRGHHDEFPPHWDVKVITEVGQAQLGQQRHPKFKTGTNVRPYLRVANVLDGWIDFSDLESMHFPESDLGKFELQSGDILLNEGQSTELVGRSAIYRGEISGCCVQKTLIRYRCGPRLLPEFAQAYFQHVLYTGQFASMVVQTTSMAHLTAVRFKRMRIPAPPLPEQREIASKLGAVTSAASAVSARITATKELRSRLIAEALEA